MKLNTKIIKRYLSACEMEKRLSPKTIKAYRSDLEQFREYLIAEDKVFDRDTLKGYFALLNSQFKPLTVKRKRASLRALVTWLIDERFMDRNPFENLHLKIQQPKLLPRDIPLHEIGHLLSVAYDRMNRQADNGAALCETAVMELLFATGLRVSELSDLRTQDVNLVDGVIRIYGKGAKERVVGIGNKEVLTLLRSYEARFQPDRNGTFFQNRNGDRLSEQSVRRIVHKYTKIAGIPTRITPHMFRHSLAAMLVGEEVSIRIVQRLLGHSSILTTQIYTHVADQKQREIIAAKHPRNKLSFPVESVCA